MRARDLAETLTMAERGHRIRMGLPAKLLVPVGACLVLLPVVTLWIVGRHLTRELEDEATRTVMTAESVFVQSLENRNRSTLARYESLVGEARFKMLAESGDGQTLDGLLGGLLQDSPEAHEAAFLIDRSGAMRSSRRRTAGVDIAQLLEAATRVTQPARHGEATIGCVGFDRRVYSVIAVPVTAPNGMLAGALAIAVRIGEATLRELKLGRTEVLLTIGDDVVVATLPGVDRGDFARGQDNRGDVEQVVWRGEHHLARVRRIDPRDPSVNAVRYGILSSYEQRREAMLETRWTLLLISAVGVLASGGVAGWLVQRATQPLRELSEAAEAVGRGDFSRRVARFSDDECGDLAEAFNGMATRLQNSRAELQRSVQQLQASQQQLAQREKLAAVGRFVAGVERELNNPLTVVVGLADLLQSTTRDETMRGHLDRIGRNAHRCYKVVQDLRGFARPPATERKRVNLHHVVDEVLEIMSHELRTGNVTVVREFAVGLPPILADAHQLRQVFLNLLGNARQALEPVPQVGRVTIRTRRHEARVTIEFADNGPGIPAEHLERIFDPFFTTKPVGQGAGLGLSLCYGLVREHGGEITVRSEPGGGATFAVELPAAGPAAEPGLDGMVLPRSAPRRSDVSGKAVLVIDGEKWIRDLARELAAADGHDVVTAAGKEEAIEHLARRSFDVIVSDWKLPGLNGQRLYEHLLATDAAAAARVVFMTGDVVSDTFQRFLQQHGLAGLAKPFAGSDFRGAIARAGAARVVM